MTDEQKAALQSLLRSGLLVAGGIAVGKGWLTSDMVNQIVTAVLVLAPAVWGALDKFIKKG